MVTRQNSRSKAQRRLDRARFCVAHRQLTSDDVPVAQKEDRSARDLVDDGRNDTPVRDTGRAMEAVRDRVVRMDLVAPAAKCQLKPVGVLARATEAAASRWE